MKDLLLQSISVLVQYKEFMHVFENNKEAINGLPRSLLSAFDNRSWIPVTNILFRLCKGSGFASSKNAESSSSATFQVFSNVLTLIFTCCLILPASFIMWWILSFWFLRFYLGRHAFMKKNCSIPSSIDFSTHLVGRWLSSLCPSERCKINTR